MHIDLSLYTNSVGIRIRDGLGLGEETEGYSVPYAKPEGLSSEPRNIDPSLYALAGMRLLLRTQCLGLRISTG